MAIADWPFDQGPQVAAITTRQVLNEGLPIIRVIHYSEDEDWAFVCGTTSETEDLRVVAMKTMFKLDPTLCTIADLPLGWTAWRQFVGAPWNREKNEDE